MTKPTKVSGLIHKAEPGSVAANELSKYARNWQGRKEVLSALSLLAHSFLPRVLPAPMDKVVTSRPGSYSIQYVYIGFEMFLPCCRLTDTVTD